MPEAATQPAAARPAPRPAFIPPPPERHIAEGSFFIASDRSICQIADGQAEPVTYGGTLLKTDGTLTAKRLAALVGLRDLARQVLTSQNEGWPEEHRQDARRELNRAYDLFAAAYGPINKTTFSAMTDGGTIRRMPNLVKFREDPDAMLVMSLEDYDEVTGKATKAPILLKDVVGKSPPVTSVASAEEGLLVSLDRRGAIDLPFIASLYGKPEAAVIAELGDLIYRDPDSQSWQTADAYLSGDVRAKLRTAEQAGPDYTRNAEALRTVQPEDVLPGDIDAGLGAPWIPASDIQSFAAELFRVGAFRRAGRTPEERRGVEPGRRPQRAGVGRRHRRVRHAAGQRHLAAGAGPQHENPRDLRHDPGRKRRGADRQPGGDARRPREAEADQGTVQELDIR